MVITNTEWTELTAGNSYRNNSGVFILIAETDTTLDEDAFRIPPYHSFVAPSDKTTYAKSTVAETVVLEDFYSVLPTA